MTAPLLRCRRDDRCRSGSRGAATMRKSARSLIFPRLFGALRQAGVPDGVAEEAAAELTQPFVTLEERLARLEVKVNVLLITSVAILLLVLRKLFVVS